MSDRSHTCGELNLHHTGEDVTLFGWVHAIRNLGGLLFLQIRDRYGVTQATFNEENNPELFRNAAEVRSEYVVEIRGMVTARTPENINPQMKTGEIEIIASAMTVLNTSELPPFEIQDDVRASEELRMKYRYLDLRRRPMTANMVLRHKVCMAVRNYLDEQDFLEIETPFLTRSTPEGARDYLVPSRIHAGKFYALPQSPQLFKQLLMISGMDRYYQIVRCFRDEDLRADRQPEFTQVDIEMSFIQSGDIFALLEPMMTRVIKLIGAEIHTPFPRLTFQEAMDRFGTDRPDTRFGLEIHGLGEFFRESEFGVFRRILTKGGHIRGFVVPGGSRYSRREIDGFQDLVKTHGAAGLAWIKCDNGQYKSSLPKVVAEEEKTAVVDAVKGKDGDIVFMVAGDYPVVCSALGALRLHLAAKEGLVDENTFNFTWIVDFPMFEWNDECKRFVACHHPFTAPKDSDFSNPATALSMGYDLVLNGIEIAGGSIRIHQEKLQKKIFKVLGIDDCEAHEKFGFLLDALRFGTPPHGGIALGLDRLVMILAGEKSIRDVIPFPKSTSAMCLLTSSPAEVSVEQLQELKLKIQDDNHE